MADDSEQRTFELAVQHKDAGRLMDAEKVCHEMLKHRPADARVLNLLGKIVQKQGSDGSAVEFFRRSISISPGYVKSHVDLGNALENLGKFDEAILAYRQAVALNPDLAMVHCSIGNVLQKKKEYEGAILSYEKAIMIRPEDVLAHSGVALAMMGQQRFSDAISAAEKALSLDSSLPDVHYGLANALGKVGRYKDAIESYQQAIALRPDAFKMLIDLGHAQHLAGQLDASIETAEKVIAENPGAAGAYMLMGKSLAEKCLPDQAIVCFRKAISIRPNLAKAHSDLGAALKAVGELDQAIAECRRAVELDPTNAAFHSRYLFMLHFHEDFDAAALAEEGRKWNRQHALPLEKESLPVTRAKVVNRPLRIGYISCDLDGHRIGWSLLSLFANHNRKRFRIFCYAQVNRPDAVTKGLEQASDNWRDMVGLSGSEVAAKIREDQIDILVDLSLHTLGNRLLVFARRPAPLQISWLGYPGSTGLTAINYRLSDVYLDPVGTDLSVYSEKTFRLPETFWCYQPRPGVPDIGPLPARYNGYITFGCLNSFAKISRSTLETWGKILQAIPASRLHLHAYQGNSRVLVETKMMEMGIGRERLEFSDRGPVLSYFETYNKIDIALDPFPFAGGITTCDALWMGVPVISLRGKTVTGRLGVSILSNIGMTELIANTVEQYIEKSTTLGSDLDRLGQLRSSLREHMASSPMMQAKRFVHHLEVAYRNMWRSM